jgi:hypothetical protein
VEDITAETSEMIFFQLPFYIDVEQFCVRIRPRWPGWKVLDHDVWLVGATVRVDDIDLAALLREVQTAVSELHLDAIRYCLDGRFYIMEGVRLEGTTHVVRSIPDRQAV